LRLYLLDTNLVSYAAADNPRIHTKLAALARSGHICISALTEAELRYGMEKTPPSREKQLAIEGYLAKFHVLPWSADAAKAYAKLRVANEKGGQTISLIDLLIAAHAVAEGAILLTNDARLAEIKGAEVERWKP